MTWHMQLDWELEQYAYRLMAIETVSTGKAIYLSHMQFTLTDNPQLNPGMAPKIKPVYIKDRGFIQALVDAAWKEGIRPEALQADASEIGATKRHLEDMRNIVAEKLGVPLLFKVGK